MPSAGALPRNAKSLLAWAGHFYFMRVILVGMVLGIVLVTAGHTGFTVVNLFLLLFGASYPHLCRLLFGEREGQRRRGNISLLIDGFFVGAVMPAIGFATLPCLVMLVINLFNWMAIGGPLLATFGSLVMLLALVISGTFSRYAHALNLQDPMLDLLSYGLLIAYFLLVSGVVYRYASALQRRSAELQAQKNAAEIGNRRAERALLAVLPPSAARELHAQGEMGQRCFTDATLLLVDFAGAMPPCGIAELGEHFRSCDGIFSRHGMERIKTSNRRYLAMAREPGPATRTGESEANALFGPDAALAAAEELLAYLRNHGDAATADATRIFIHCGAVEAGLVQPEHFNYDLVGSCVDELHALAHRTWQNNILLTASAQEHLRGNWPLAAAPGATGEPVFALVAQTPAPDPVSASAQ